MGKPFRAPPRDFNKNMNYDGEREVDGKKYQSFELLMDVNQGPFQYNFWDGEHEYNNQTYYVPQSFNFLGFGESGNPNIWLYQAFENFRTGKPDESVWEIPDSCR